MRYKISGVLLGVMALSMWAQISYAKTGEETSACASGQPMDSIICNIYGTVIDRPETTSVMIVGAGRDLRIHDYVTVPVVEGKFAYTLHDTIPMAYDVIFDDELKYGDWQIRNFFSGNGSVNLFYHNGDKADDDSVVSNIRDNILAERFSAMSNAEISACENRLSAVIDSLYDNNAAYSKDIQLLHDKLHSLPDGQEKDSIRDLVGRRFRESRENADAHSNYYSKEYLEYEKALTDLYLKRDLMKRNFITENPSLFGLFSIREAIMMYRSGYNWLDIGAYEDIFETVYKKRYGCHPYTEEISGMLEARNVKAGNKYPDYKIRREDGSTEQISSLIKGKVAVIDLWASWCGPCRKHSMELIPIYEKYKDKGFMVVAIARESDNCIAMNKAMEKDGYPWESFVDLNDRDKVWRINKADNAGGKIILVDSDGVIAGTDMRIEEIKDFLEKVYGE